MSVYTDLVNNWMAHLPENYRGANRILVVDGNGGPQRMASLQGVNIAAEFLVSTARNGFGDVPGSDETPVGWHKICAKIGAGLAPGAVFKEKTFTGTVWSPDGGSTFPALMLSRLLVLDGLELGLNKGGQVDSFDRGIYIHGTNCTAELGQPASHGCVRMNYQDVVTLFDTVDVNDLVLIAAGSPL